MSVVEVACTWKIGAFAAGLVFTFTVCAPLPFVIESALGEVVAMRMGPAKLVVAWLVHALAFAKFKDATTAPVVGVIVRVVSEFETLVGMPLKPAPLPVGAR